MASNQRFNQLLKRSSRYCRILSTVTYQLREGTLHIVQDTRELDNGGDGMDKAPEDGGSKDPRALKLVRERHPWLSDSWVVGIVAFEFPEDAKNSFYEVLQACVQDGLSEVEVRDQAFASSNGSGGLSAIATPHLLQVLILVALEFNNQDLAKALSYKATSPPADEAKMVHAHLSHSYSLGWHGLRSDVKAIQILNGWRDDTRCENPYIWMYKERDDDLLIQLIEAYRHLHGDEQMRYFEKGHDLLEDAVKQGRISVLRHLLKTYSLTEDQKVGPRNILVLAGIYQSTAMLDVLLENGVEIDGVGIREGLPHTALVIAISRGKVDVVRWLLEHGATWLPDLEGRMPVEQAKFHGHDDIVQVLVQNEVKQTEDA